MSFAPSVHSSNDVSDTVTPSLHRLSISSSSVSPSEADDKSPHSCDTYISPNEQDSASASSSPSSSNIVHIRSSSIGTQNEIHSRYVTDDSSPCRMSSPMPVSITLTRKRGYDMSSSPIPKRIKHDDDIYPLVNSSSHMSLSALYHPSSRAKHVTNTSSVSRIYSSSPSCHSRQLHHSHHSFHQSPSVSPSSPSSPCPVSPIALTLSATRRILLICTSATSRLITSNHLAHTGMYVDVAHTWEMGLSLWQQHRYHVVLCDVDDENESSPWVEYEHDEEQSQPSHHNDAKIMHFITNLRQFEEKQDDEQRSARTTVVLGVTQQITHDVIQRCCTLGMDGWIQKSTDMGEALIETIEQTTYKRTPIFIPAIVSSLLPSRRLSTNISSPASQTFS